jgi:two-component system OmpR family sensor kinase
LLGIALRRGLAPLSRATHDIRDRSASSLASIDSKEMPDELRPLGDAINALLQRLHAALEAQKRLVADAAHELRTPLTALRLEVEALVRAPDDASRRAAAGDTLKDLQRASRVVEQLLRLSRAGPEAELQREPVDLGVLAQRTVVLFSPLASARGIDLGADVEPRPAGDFVIDGDPGQLGVMLENLVDNALRYTPAGGRVDVQVRIDPATNDAVLSVIDSGPGMPSEERERAFARFYRGSSARRGDVAGSGLGLAIVKATAEGHEAQVVLNEGLGLAPGAPGLSATISFPRRSA